MRGGSRRRKFSRLCKWWIAWKPILMLSMHILLPRQSNFKNIRAIWKFRFNVIMSTRENIPLIARAPFPKSWTFGIQIQKFRHVVCQHIIKWSNVLRWTENKLEDLKVLRRSPDLFNNVKVGQGQLLLIIKTCFVLPYMGFPAILVKWPIKVLMNILHQTAQWFLRNKC